MKSGYLLKSLFQISLFPLSFVVWHEDDGKSTKDGKRRGNHDDCFHGHYRFMPVYTSTWQCVELGCLEEAVVSLMNSI